MTNEKKGKAKAVETQSRSARGRIPEKYFVVDTSALEYGMDVFEKIRQGGRKNEGTDQ